MRAALLRPLVLGSALAPGLLLGRPAAAQDGPVVSIANFTFAPRTLIVAAGDTVTFVNRDDIPHSVRAVDGGFKCAAMDTGESCRIAFKTVGEFKYFCALHPMMTGIVVVRAK